MKQKALLIVPAFQETGTAIARKYLKKYLGKHTITPALNLLVIANYLEKYFDPTYLDLNLPLYNNTTETIAEHDIVFSYTHLTPLVNNNGNNIKTIIEDCHKAKVPIALGGPFLHNINHHGLLLNVLQVTYLLIGEGELVLNDFCQDFLNGKAKRIYCLKDGFVEKKLVIPDQKECHYIDHKKVDLEESPMPRYDLLEIDKYFEIPMEFSRGCPFQCAFCLEYIRLGNKMRYRTLKQIEKELYFIYELGFRGRIVIVDENFIGNLAYARKILKTIIKVNKKLGNPFYFTSQISINIADHPDILALLCEAQFHTLCIGVESVFEENLRTINKKVNLTRSLNERIEIIHSFGLEIIALLIMGFDADPSDTEQITIDFLEKNRISKCRIGTLGAIPGSKLYEDLQSQNRILELTMEDVQNYVIMADVYMPIFKTKKPREKIVKDVLSSYNKLFVDDNLKGYLTRSLGFLRKIKNKTKKYPYPHWRALGYLCKIGIAHPYLISPILTFLTKVLFLTPGQLARGIELCYDGIHYHLHFKHHLGKVKKDRPDFKFV